MHRRLLATDSVCFILATQARKLSLPASLKREEEALKRHEWGNDGDAAIEVKSFSSL